MRSLYGMTDIDLAGFKEACVEAGPQIVFLYLDLMVGRHNLHETETRLKALQFDRVYPLEVDLDRSMEDLSNNLRHRGKRQYKEVIAKRFVMPACSCRASMISISYNLDSRPEASRE
jgi:hypothetical protein